MLFEDKSTKCPNCKTSLTWKSHVKRRDQGRLVDEFTFRCESCKREYEFKDDKVLEKKRGRDPIAESQALDRSLRLAAMNRRCDNCGGPITRSHGIALCCDWCHQEYRIVDGQVQPTIEDSPTHRLSMSDFYAL